MQCIYCGAAMPKRGLICDYCGKRNPLNLTSLEKMSFESSRSSITLTCPDCKTDTETINIGLAEEMIVHRCHQCDGIFLSEKTLEDAIRHQVGSVHKVDHSMLRFVLDNPRNETDNNQAYRSCPVCNRHMNKGIYAAISGVLIDKCPKHGIWLDSGELQQLLEWKSVYTSLKRKEIQENKRMTPPKQSPRSLTPETTRDPIEHFFHWLLLG